MSVPCAVIGVGQTRHAASRPDLSMPGLVREAARRALDDAGLDYKDIDAVVLGKAPDMFEGVVQPELFLAGALGGVGKPMMRSTRTPFMAHTIKDRTKLLARVRRLK